MAFSKTEIKRFNDVIVDTPAPGSYDPKRGDKTRAAIITKGGRFPKLPESSELSKTNLSGTLTGKAQSLLDVSRIRNSGNRTLSGDFGRKLREVQTEVQRLKEKVKDRDNNLLLKDKELEQLENSRSDLLGHCKDVEAEMAKLRLSSKGEADDMMTTRHEKMLLEKELSQTNHVLSDKLNENQKLKANFDTERANLRRQIGDLDDELLCKKEEIIQLRVANEHLETEKNQLLQRIQFLEAEYATQISDLRDALGKAKAEIISLNLDNDQLKEARAEHGEELEGIRLELEIAKKQDSMKQTLLQEQINELSKSLEEARTRENNAICQAHELSTRLRAHEEEAEEVQEETKQALRNLEARMRQDLEDNEILKNDLENATDQIAAFNKEVEISKENERLVRAEMLEQQELLSVQHAEEFSAMAAAHRAECEDLRATLKARDEAERTTMARLETALSELAHAQADATQRAHDALLLESEVEAKQNEAEQRLEDDFIARLGLIRQHLEDERSRVSTTIGQLEFRAQTAERSLQERNATVSSLEEELQDTQKQVEKTENARKQAERDLFLLKTKSESAVRLSEEVEILERNYKELLRSSQDKTNSLIAEQEDMSAYFESKIKQKSQKMEILVAKIEHLSSLNSASSFESSCMDNRAENQQELDVRLENALLLLEEAIEQQRELHEQCQNWSKLTSQLEEQIAPYKEKLGASNLEKQSLHRSILTVLAELEKVTRDYVSIVGHQNPKQKIQHVTKLKQENQALKMETDKQRETISKLKRALQNEQYKHKRFPLPNASFMADKENVHTLTPKKQLKGDTD